MRISPEDGQLMQEEPAAQDAEGFGASVASEDWRRSSRLASTVVSALDGSLPVTRPLHSWENKKLSPKHIQMCFDKADGLSNVEIAAKYEMTAGRVCTILKHPDAEFLIGELLGTLADRIADPIERMRALSHEMINKKLEIVRDMQTPRVLQNDIASDFLDRAGYGARKKLDVEAVHSIAIPASAVARLADALDASRRVASIDYSQFVAPKQLEGTTSASAPGSMTQQGQEDLMPTGGHLDADNGASPDDLPVAAPDDWRTEEKLAREEFDEPVKRGRGRPRMQRSA